MSYFDKTREVLVSFWTEVQGGPTNTLNFLFPLVSSTSLFILSLRWSHINSVSFDDHLIFINCA